MENVWTLTFDIVLQATELGMPCTICLNIAFSPNEDEFFIR